MPLWTFRLRLVPEYMEGNPLRLSTANLQLVSLMQQPVVTHKSLR